MDTKRGSVLIGALLFAIVAAGIAFVIVSDTLNANLTRLREESYADALSAAEYGAEIAASEISGVLAADMAAADPFAPGGGAVDADRWVTGDAGSPALFSATTGNKAATDADQRRIGGFYNNHEFRVRVRSANLAYRNKLVGAKDSPLPDGWLFDPANSGDYRGAYEITATARPRGAAARLASGSNTGMDAAAYSTPVVQLIMGSPFSPAERLLNQAAPLMLEHSLTGRDANGDALFKTAATMLADTDIPMVPTAEGVAAEVRPVYRNEYSVRVSGEDHNLRTEMIPSVKTSQKITTPLRLKTEDSLPFGASGGYWDNGQSTLNFIDIDSNNPVDMTQKYKDVTVTTNEGNKAGGAARTRTVRMPVPNTQRPYNRTTQTNFPNTSYAVGSQIPENTAMWAQFNDGRTPDAYFLGGKPRLTVDYTSLPLSGDPNNPQYFVNGGKNQKPPWTASGYITSTTADSAKFNIVLGSFEDLPKLYLNIIGTGSTDHRNYPNWMRVYVGQYSRIALSTTTVGASLPLLNWYANSNGTGGVTNKVRPQTIHMIMNQDNRMLVRAYEADIPVRFNTTTRNLETQTVYFAQEAGATGNYYLHYNQATGALAYLANDRTADAGWQKYSTSRQSWKAEWKGKYMWVKTEFMADPRNTSTSLTRFVVAENETVTLPSAGNRGNDLVLTLKRRYNPGNASRPTDAELNNSTCVPRQFFWQELVGYSLEKDWDTARYGEPALIADGLGRTAGGSGFYGTRDDHSLRTFAYEDASGKRITVGFDEAYQRSPVYDPDSPHSDTTTVNPITKETNDLQKRWRDVRRGRAYPAYLVDAHDPIPVVDSTTGVVENKYSMDDFLFQRMFIMDSDSNGDGIVDENDTINREAVGIFIGYEDSPGQGGDYNYRDMFFTIFVSPRATEAKVEDMTNVFSETERWWEQKEDKGLTGKVSHPALGINMQEGADPNANLKEDYFNSFVVGDKTGFAKNAWTMFKNGTSEFINFPLAKFKPDGPFNNGVFDGDDEAVDAFLNPQDGSPGHTVFYCTDPDLLDYIQYRVGLEADQEAAVKEWIDQAGDGDWLYDKAITEIKQIQPPEYSHITFKRVRERYDSTLPDQTAVKRTEQGFLPDSLTVYTKPFSFRQIAGEIAGSAIVNAETVKTKNLSPVESPPVIDKEDIGYIAGETMPDDTIVPARPETLIFPEEVDAQKTRRTGNVKLFTAAVKAPRDKAAFDAAAAEAVKLCYGNSPLYPTKADMEELQKTFGVKEERYAIGFHRSGKDYGLLQDNLQDRTEIVVLGVEGFEPFRTTTFTGGDGAKHTAVVKDDISGGAPANPVYAIASNYARDPATGTNNAPTFVFEGQNQTVYGDRTVTKSIDGAGVLIVNGNLHIKTTFAYHGILIVLGDLVIEPAAHSEFLYNPYGQLVNASGQGVAFNEETDTWFPVNEKGEHAKDDSGKLLPGGDEYRPHIQQIHRGELIAQGIVMVRGEIETMQRNGFTGALHAVWSSEAVESALGAVGYNRSPLLRRIIWNHDDDISVDSLWADRVDFAP